MLGTAGRTPATNAANIAGRPRSGSCEPRSVTGWASSAGVPGRHGLVARAELAATVSAAGGLKVVGAGSTSGADELRAEICGVGSGPTARSASTSCLQRCARRHSEATRFCRPGARHGGGRARGTGSVLISGFGQPQGRGARSAGRGIFVMSVVGAVKHAQRARADGVDARSPRLRRRRPWSVRSAPRRSSSRRRRRSDRSWPAAAWPTGPRPRCSTGIGRPGRLDGDAIVAPRASARTRYKAKIVGTDTAGTVVTRAHV